MILPASDPESIAACVDRIRDGGLIGLPTETVYGLAADADNDAAVAKIFAAKGRPADHPLIVHVSAQDGGMLAVSHFAAAVPPFAQQLMSAFWPGPLTLILPRRAGVGTASAGGQNSIGLRCPAHPAAQAILRALRDTSAGRPAVWGIAAPSANRFGRVSPTTAAHVDRELGPNLLVLDGGPCELGIESTIIDCTRGTPVLLRPGSISRLQVEQACGQKLVSKEELAGQALRGIEAPRASGTLESHYAPNAKVRLMDATALQAAVDLLGGVMYPAGSATQPSIAIYARTPLKKVPLSIALRRMPDDAAATAHQLFAVMRAMDETGVKLIWVETPPDAPQWEGVMDRLQRAST
jgi:L-threonylcarbamoyladenylate synthase